MEHGVSAGDYKDLLLFLATAGIVAPLLQRIRISPILGFLAAGVALGPFGLGSLVERWPWLSNFTVSEPEQMSQLAEFGVAFLLFTIGLELSWERLRLMRKLVFGLGAMQVTLCGLAIGGAGWALGLSPTAAAVVGAALALSSTAVSLPVLREQKRLHSPAGRSAFSVLLFQDLAVAPILVVVGVLGAREALTPTSALVALGPAVAGMVVLVLIGRLLLRPMMRSVARARSDELFLAATLLVVIGAGLLAAVSGLSMALGAFVAGLLLAETEYRHDVELRVEPFKGLLLGLFFVSVGISLNLGVLVERPLIIIGTAVGFVAVKAGLVYGAARLFRHPPMRSLETALALAAGGEFAFVILNEALDGGLLPPAVGESVLIAATLSMFLIPALIWAGALVGAASDGRDGREASADLAPAGDDETPRVLIVGFGRVGQLVADMLSRHDIPWVAVDRSPGVVRRGRHDDKRTFFGDASQPELLRRCGLATARALVVTMDSPEAVEAVVASARRLRTDMPIVARARDARHAGKLYALGATNAVPETIEASLQLSEAVLVDVGVPMGFVIASVHEKRDEYRKMLNQPERQSRPRRTPPD
jgi:CPA2 family monovalent cation:H+ antiporter-2